MFLLYNYVSTITMFLLEIRCAPPSFTSIHLCFGLFLPVQHRQVHPYAVSASTAYPLHLLQPFTAGKTLKQGPKARSSPSFLHELSYQNMNLINKLILRIKDKHIDYYANWELLEISDSKSHFGKITQRGFTFNFFFIYLLLS